MITSLEIRLTASRPQMPLAPWFAFKDSPSSVRIIDVPKKVGAWDITGVQLQVLYPNNIAVTKNAVRSGSCWVATVEGSGVAGKVVQGYQVTASGTDEDGNPVEGYVLGCGDVFIMEATNDIKTLVGKSAVRFLDDLPVTPVAGDMVLHNGGIKFYDGEEWINFGNAEDIPTKVSQLENDVGYITEEAIPSDISSFNNDVGYITAEAIPSAISSFENDVGYITASAIPSQISSFENDVGYITASAIPSNVSAFNNDVGYLSAVSWNDVQDKPAIPSRTSDLTNDAGYVTASAVAASYYNKTEVSAFLSTKQDALTTPQMSAINAEVANRKTVVKFNNNTTAEYDVVGEVTQAMRQGWESAAGSTVKEVEFGSAVTSIGNSAFLEINALTTVKLSDSIQSIGSNAFSYCRNLANLDLGHGVTNIGSAFLVCNSLTSVTIPDSVQTIQGYAFQDCANLTTFVLPDSVKVLNRQLFYGCTSLANLKLGGETTTIDQFTFKGTALTEIEIPSIVTSIGANAFQDCASLTSVVFKGKTLTQVQNMTDYPWGISDTSIITTWNDASKEYVDGIVGNINTALDNINGEVI